MAGQLPWVPRFLSLEAAGFYEVEHPLPLEGITFLAEPMVLHFVS